jgi:hypothetical protein
VTCYATGNTHFELLIRFIYNLTTITYNTVAYFHLNSLKFTAEYSSVNSLLPNCRPPTAKLSLQTLLTKLFTKTQLLYLERGWYRLGTDRTENSLFPLLLRTSVYCLVSKQPATLFPLCDFIGASRCLATGNAILLLRGVYLSVA